MNSSDDLTEAATALLATVKKVMSGREIEACEWAKSDEVNDDWSELHRYSGFVSFYDFDDEGNMNTWQIKMRETAFKIGLIEKLANQFPSEIRNWIDKRQRAQARRATKIPA